jgi:hypothetical protein
MPRPSARVHTLKAISAGTKDPTTCSPAPSGATQTVSTKASVNWLSYSSA